MSEPILIAQDLKKSFGELEAVKGISLQVARGEVFGLLGPNGAGKTTTISMLTGLLEPSGGKITVDGLDLGQHTREVKARLGLPAGQEKNGFGLRGLCERATQLGGELHIEPRPGGGTQLSFRVPLSRAESQGQR